MDALGIFWIIFWSIAIIVVVIISRITHTSLFSTAQKGRSNHNENSTDSKIVNNVTQIQERHSNSIVSTACDKGSDTVNCKTANQNPENSFQHNEGSLPDDSLLVNHKKLGSRDVNR